uniref:HMA domain-containing protein n=1 Tax=Oryza meridionalis TaxID=40149 RepID=A0A0E0DWX6_9ORYZ
MEMDGLKQFRLQIDMQCRCMGCIRKIEKAMVCIGSVTGVESSVADVDTGIVAVAGKVNPTMLCHWLKRRIRKDVKIVYPDQQVQNSKQKLIMVLGSSSNAKGAHNTPSALPIQDHMSWDSVPPIVQSNHQSLPLIEQKIRELEKVRDMLKIQNLETELGAVRCELKQSREAINGSKKAVMDSALNQLEAYHKLEALSHSPFESCYPSQ